MQDLPGNLDADADRDLRGRERHQLGRRMALGALTLFVLAALLNVFGQRTTTTVAAEPAAALSVQAPSRLRGGLIFEGRFRIDAREAIAEPTLVLQSGWIDAITLNSIEPAPTTERSLDDGSIAFDLPPIAAGGSSTLYTQWQVNPTALGRTSADVELRDGDRSIARVERTVTIFP